MLKKRILLILMLVFTIVLTGCGIQQRDIVDTSLAEQAYAERHQNDIVTEDVVEVDMILITPIEE